MAEGGIFLDVLTRLNMASVDRVLRDVKTAMREGGVSAGRDFSEGFNTAFGEITRSADTAYRQMQTGMAELQRAEAQINDLRVRGYQATTAAMVSAQREVDAALLNTQKLIAESNRALAAQREGSAAALAGGGGRGSGGRDEPEGRSGRTIPAPLGRVGNIIGAGSALAGVGALAYGTRSAAREEYTLNDILNRHQDTAQNVGVIRQGLSGIGRETGFTQDQLADAAERAEQAGYRGADALKVIETAARTAKIAHAELDTTLAGLTTTMQDFGVKALAGDAAKLPGFLQGMNDIAGKFIVTVANLKDVNPAEYFKSLANIEPIAAEYMSGVDKIQATTQVDAIAAMMSQIGMPPERGMLNLAQAMSKAGQAKGVTATYMEQLGINPEGFATQLQNQGFIPVLQTLQGALDKRYNPQTGMYDMGFRFNDAGQLQALQQMDIEQLQGMGEQGQIALGLINSPAFQGATEGFKANKDLREAGITDPTVTGMVKNWLTFQSKRNGPSAAVKAGRMPELTEAQVVGSIFGTGDTARTVIASLQNLPMLQNLQGQYAEQGDAAGFQKSFQQWTQSFMAQMDILKGQWSDITTTLGQRVLPTLDRWAHDLNDFLDKHQNIGGQIIDAMIAVGGIWLTFKTVIGAAKLVEAVQTLAGASGALASAETTAAGELGAAGLGSKFAAIGGAAGGLLTALGVVTADLLALKLSYDWGVSHVNQRMQESIGEHTLPNRPNNNDGTPRPNDVPPPSPGGGYQIGPGGIPYIPRARGGIVGYAGGTDKVANPYSQPLMGQRDMGGDSVLGMLPGGMPVGLRGGEGILTPEAVSRLGGKEGIDSLNSGKNPWSNPMHVATTFYGSFAKGVAKYSPWGKYLEASSKGLDALEKEQERADKEGRRIDEGILAGEGLSGRRGHRGLPLEIEEMLDSGMTPEQIMQTLGVTQGKRGGFELPSGQYLSKEDRAMLGLPAASPRGGGDTWFSKGESLSSWIREAEAAAGVDASWTPGLKTLIGRESSGNPGAINLWDSNAVAGHPSQGLMQLIPGNFSQYHVPGTSGDIDDPVANIAAGIRYIQGTYPGGIGGVQQANPNMPPKGYSGGGIVGYDIGGIIPPPPPPPAGPTAGNGLAPMDHPDTKPSGPPGPSSGLLPQGKTTPQTPARPPSPPQGQMGQSLGKSPSKPPAGAAQPSGPIGDRNIKDNPSQPLTAEGKGFGVGGGLIGAAESAAAGMGGPFGAAAQPAFQLMNRAIGYGGQLVGIGIEGLMSTFLPNDDPAADPSKNVFGKMALGIAGMHKGPDNGAGKSAMQLNPKQDLDQGSMMGKQFQPGSINIHGDVHNHSSDHREFSNVINRGIMQNGGLPIGGST